MVLSQNSFFYILAFFSLGASMKWAIWTVTNYFGRQPVKNFFHCAKLAKFSQALRLASLLIVLRANCAFAQGVQWVKYQDPRTGQTISALFLHPAQGQKLPAVIYNHGKIIELVGYQGGLQKGYDVAEFVNALAHSGYAAIAPIRPANTGFNFGPIIRGTMRYLMQRPDVDPKRIGMIGFSKGGFMTLEAAGNIESLKAVVTMSPAKGNAPTSEAQLGKIKAPLLVTLGKLEKNDEIGRATESTIVRVMQKLGKKIYFIDTYNGDHQWFYKVRQEYWRDIIDFLGKHL